MKHGTFGTYGKYKCRCDLCVEAKRDYDKKNYQKNPQKYRDISKRYRLEHPEYREKQRQQSKKYFEINRDKNRENCLRYRRENPSKAMLADYLKSDKKKGLLNDLTVEFIDTIVLNPCSYCETVARPRRLDRIDNRIGHTIANVVSCCTNCNIFRRNMKYDLWMRFSPVLRQLEEEGRLSESLITSYGNTR